MNQLGHLLLIPLSGTGQLVINFPSTSPVQGFDLGDPRNLFTHFHLISEDEFESTIRFIFDGTGSLCVAEILKWKSMQLMQTGQALT